MFKKKKMFKINAVNSYVSLEKGNSVGQEEFETVRFVKNVAFDWMLNI